MATSQNGWPVYPDSTGLNKTFAPVAFPNGVRPGDVATLLGHVATAIHERVEPLVSGWCWGYNYRPIRGQSTGFSNHASATAIDVNAPDHPQGKRGTWSPAEVAELRKILAECGGVVRWGGDYSGTLDEMHFEINAGSAAVNTAANHLRANPPAGRPLVPLEDDMALIVPAAKDDYVSVPCNGARNLFISTGFDRKVKVLGIAGVTDNTGKGEPGYVKIGNAVDINPDQPGPIAIDPGCRVVQLRYSADHAFTVWCA